MLQQHMQPLNDIHIWNSIKLLFYLNFLSSLKLDVFFQTKLYQKKLVEL